MNKIKLVKKLDNYKTHILGVEQKRNIAFLRTIKKELFNYSFSDNNLYNKKFINLYFEKLKEL